MTRLAFTEAVNVEAFRASIEGLASQAPTPEASEDVRRAADVAIHTATAGAPPALDSPLLRRTAVALQWLAQVARKEKDLPLAALTLETAVQLDPTPELTNLLAAVLEEASSWRDLLSVLSRALAAEKTAERRRDLYRRLGRVHEEGLRDYRTAATLYGMGLAEFPDATRLLQDQARCLEALREFALLLPVVERQIALDTDPNRLALLHSRAATLSETLGDVARALEHFRESVRLSPKLDPPIQGLLALAEAKEDWVTVIEVLKERLKVEARPRERGMILTRAGELIAQRMGDHDHASAFFERAIREYPRALSPRLHLLEYLCSHHQFARAERFATPPDVADSQGLSPDDFARLCRYRAIVANERGRPVEAVECLCLALRVSSRPLEVLDALVQLERAERPEMRPPPELMRFAEEQVRRGDRPTAALALVAIALLELGWGRPQSAETGLRHALTLAPERLEVRRLLAELYRTQRRHAEAVTVLQLAARDFPAERAVLSAEAARVLADHLADIRGARRLLAELREAGLATVETRVLEAGLAFADGDRAGAAELLAGVDAPGDPAVAVLRLKLVEARNDDEATRVRAREQAAAAGSPKVLRQLIGQRFAEGGLAATEALLESVPTAARANALRLAGDVLRHAGRPDEAQYYYLRAFAAAPTSMDALEPLALISPAEAATKLRLLLEANPVDGRAAALLSSLVATAGDEARAEALTHVALALRGQLTPPSPVDLVMFSRVVTANDPLLDVIQSLRDGMSEAFDREEAALYAGSQQAVLPPHAAEVWAQAAALFTDAPPELRFSARAGSNPMVLARPDAILISPALLHGDMPPGAIVSALLRGLAAWALGVGPLTYTTTYRLDVLGEALRVAEKRTDRAGAMLAEAFELPAEQATRAVAAAVPLAQGKKTDLVAARTVHEERLARAALVATRDLTGALAAASLHAPARVAPAATAERWQRLLSRIPTARTVLAYALTEHFATLFGRSAPSA